MVAPIPLVVVVGPTAVGKTALAVELAQRFGGEIVNADSRQVYVGMDIGTAKPSPTELVAARHHLIDIRSPDQPLSLGEFIPMATETIADIAGRGGLPILCGGTGQYVWALLEGWNVPAVPPDPAFRAEMEQQAETHGGESLWHCLHARDPARAIAIGPENVRRIIRALELLHHGAGTVASTSRAEHPPYNALIIGLTAERSALYQRIDARVDRMMADGLLDEARCLAGQGYVLGRGPLSGVGYSQLGEYLSGNLTLAEAIAQTKTRTHRLVRRQYTWFKPGDPRILWLDATNQSPDEPAARQVRQFLESAPPCDTIGPESGTGRAARE